MTVSPCTDILAAWHEINLFLLTTNQNDIAPAFLEDNFFSLALIFHYECAVNVSGFPLAFAMSPLANQTKNWRNGICIFSPIWRNQINDNSNPMAKHSHCFH